MSRRSLLAGGLATAASPGWLATGRAAELSLGALAAQVGVLYGASIGDKPFSDPAYERLYLEHTRILTTDFAMIFPFVRPEKDKVEHGPGEQIAAFAAKNALPLRGHCLIWNDNLPDWVKRLSKGEMIGLLDRHVDEMVSHYRGRMHSWDVVNEPIFPRQHQPGGFRDGPWFRAMGPDYVMRAFRRAAAADPGAKLVLNEAFTEKADADGAASRAGLLRLIDDMQSAGVPLHAVGLQGHLEAQLPFEAQMFTDFLGKLAERGLEIYISELDVNDLELDGTQDERDRVVAALYRTFLGAALSVPAVKAVINWELADRYSWLRNPWFTKGMPARRRRFAARPLAFDENLRPKLVYQAMADAFRARKV